MAAADADNLIECALGGSGTFSRDCLVERTQRVGAQAITVRHPDGGFRRFMAYDDGGGIETADGAERAVIMPYQGGTEVAVGPDRYRFPADDPS